jgi:hypothetical protein
MTETLPRIAEYGSQMYKDNISTITVLRRETRRKDHGADVPAEYRYGRPTVWTLSHVTVGYVPAGACARFQDTPIWKVTMYLDGATHGQAFLSLAEAEHWLEGCGELL